MSAADRLPRARLPETHARTPSHTHTHTHTHICTHTHTHTHIHTHTQTHTHTHTHAHTHVWSLTHWLSHHENLTGIRSSLCTHGFGAMTQWPTVQYLENRLMTPC